MRATTATSPVTVVWKLKQRHDAPKPTKARGRLHPWLWLGCDVLTALDPASAGSGAAAASATSTTKGSECDEPEVLARIAELVIPPAWKDVWICPYPMGHIQATGIDDAGRKQYLYHPKWREQRDRQKFDDMIAFARDLPKLRERGGRDPRGTDELTRERVLACAIRLLDHGFFRIGSEDYAVTNETYGLATMRKEHVTLDGDDSMVFDYPAKSGQRRVQGVVDPLSLAVVARLKRRRGGGDELLAYKEGAPLARRALASTSTRSSRSRRAATTPPRTSAPGARRCWPRSG